MSTLSLFWSNCLLRWREYRQERGTQYMGADLVARLREIR